MGIVILIIVMCTIAWAFLRQKHHVLVFLCILSIFADNFRVNFGPSLLVANVIGFLVIFIIIKELYLFSPIKHLYKPIWTEFFYLIILGYVFGFMFPWDSVYSDYRLWTQRAEGRAIITLFRLLNEILLSYYIIWCFIKKKINLRLVIYMIAYISLLSFGVGLIDYFFGYWFKSNFLYVVPELSSRFLGLNGEPKMFGRNSALAYALILLYYLTQRKDKKLVFFLIINAVGVIISLSASALILFMVLNLIILLKKIKPAAFIFFSVVFMVAAVLLQNNPFFEEVTKGKIEKAFFGIENKVIPDEPQLFSRFDIFDRLGLVFLYENPQYILMGTGPNLISIPASKYVDTLPEYATFAERGGIDSVPNVMVNNILARSGIIGVILFSVFFVRLYRFSHLDKSGFAKTTVLICLFFNMVYFSVILMFLTGIIVGFIYSQRSVAARSKIIKTHT
ncbi:MAG: hypothetical protein ABS44_07410 [Chryseobacterium sp. SCN 40-13]|nr:MAG: hypothetical protein ABS44_07410 [Chryseobacterium sp. SCN 40-13]